MVNVKFFKIYVPDRYGHINQNKNSKCDKEVFFGGDMSESKKLGEVKRLTAMSHILGIIKSLHLNWDRIQKFLIGLRHSV